MFGEAVFGRVDVEHELRKRPMKAGDGAFQNHETGTGELGRHLEIHRLFNGFQLEVLLGRKVEFTRRAPAAKLDIVGLVHTVGDVVMGRVGKAHEEVGEALILRLRLVFEPGNLGLLLRHQRPESFEFFVISPGLGRPNRL